MTTTAANRFKGGIPTAAPNQAAPSQADRDAFIAGAPGKRRMPWQEGVPADARQPVNCHQPIRLMRAVAWLSQETGKSQRQIIEDALREHLSAALSRHGLEADF